MGSLWAKVVIQKSITQCSFKLMAKSVDSFFISQSYQFHHLFLQTGAPLHARVNAGHNDNQDTALALRIYLMGVDSLVFRNVAMCEPSFPSVSSSAFWEVSTTRTAFDLQDRGFHIYTMCILQWVENGFPILLLKKPQYLLKYSSVMEIEFNFISGLNAQFSL